MKKLIILAVALAPFIALANNDHQINISLTTATTLTDTLKIDLKDADKNVDKVVTIEAMVASARVFSSTALLNLGAEYPNQLLTVVLKGDAIALYKAGTKPMVKATGKVALRNGKPEMVITDKKDITITE